MTMRSGDADRLLAEARELQRTAARERDRVRKLTRRFIERAKATRRMQKQEIVADRAAVEAERRRLTAEAEQFKTTYCEFQTASAEMQQRFRESWQELQDERRRAAEERAASEAYIVSQHNA